MDVSQTIISIVLSPGGNVLTNQKVTAHLSAVDQFGNPVTLVGPFTWSVSYPSIATVTPSADTLSAEIVPLAAGSINVLVSGQGTTAYAPLTIEAVVLSLAITFDAPIPL